MPPGRLGFDFRGAYSTSVVQAESPPKRRTIVIAGSRPRRDTAIGQAMETIPFLKHRRFDRELIDSMSAAYASVRQALPERQV